MTVYKATAVNNYEFTSKDQLFLDTNIWLYVYGPQKLNDNQVAIYSQAFRRILAAQSRIYIDVLVVSEFINTYARLKWKLVKPEIERFKDFRNGLDFKPVARDIADKLRRLMNYCSRIEGNFVALEIDSLLDAYAAGDTDFNDQMITELCKREGLTLITHDRDFKGRRIPVLTANQHLLN
ncbi:MAG: PIN domain-containing protein [Nitrospira sp.]|nr:PIN domain-containing protein [Nitrospira sp.]